MPQHLGGAHGRTIALVGGCLVLAYLVTPSSVSAAATRAEYALQAEPICKSSNKDVNRSWRRYLRAAKQWPFKIQAAANALEGIGRRYSLLVSSLRLIAPPPGDEARIPQWLDLHGRAAAVWPLAASAYRLDNFKRLDRLLERSDRLQRQASSLMSGFPFRQCS